MYGAATANIFLTINNKMMRAFLIFLLSFFCIMAHAQKERTDETAVITFIKNNVTDQKCVVYPNKVDAADIQKLMDSGRYVRSIVYTKFGTVVVHEKNTSSVSQLITVIPSWQLKKEAKNKLKEGYAIDYYNKESSYAIFKKSTDITKQVFISMIDNKKVKKQNAKGMYVTLISYSEAYAQKGHNDVAEQACVSYNTMSDFLKEFKNLSSLWVVRSVAKFYNKYGDRTSYKVIYDKLRKPYKTLEALTSFNTHKELKSCFKRNINNERGINCIWCGWENRDYEAEKARAASYNGNVLEILTGLTTSIGGLVNGKGSDIDMGSSVNSTTNNNSSKNSKIKGSGRCKRCGGSGKCSPSGGASRKNACHGSGLCGYCNGTGWIKAGSSEAKCAACNGKGKCKTCHGTGKCPVCH